MDKRNVVSQLIGMVSQSALTMHMGADQVRENSMVSDPGYIGGRVATRFSPEAAAYEKAAKDRINASAAIAETPLPDKPAYATTGSLVKIRRPHQKSELYLIMPEGGGRFIETPEGEVEVISPESLLGNSLLGRKAGESFSYNAPKGRMSYTVLEIS